MIQPLTPQEKAELNAWIAEHVFGYKITKHYRDNRYYTDKGIIELPNYTDEWSAAGPLFDRYEFLLYRRDDGVYIYRNLDDLDYDVILAQGTTGPEAIAKAVKQYEEQRHER